MSDNTPRQGGNTPQRRPAPRPNNAAQPRKNGSTRRRPRRSNSGCLSSLTYMAFILGASLLLSAFVIVSANEVFAFIKPDVTATVEIPEKAKASEVAGILKDSGIISNTFLFRLFAEFYDSDSTFNEGSYELSAQMDYRELANRLRHKTFSRETVTVTIPEGTDYRRIVEILVEKGVCTAEELNEACQKVDFGYEFLKDQPENVKYKLEGFLFPDTYEFYIGDNPENVWRKFLSNFNRKYDATVQKYAAATGYNIHELITIASLIEKEAKLNAERTAISSVIYNRLDSNNFPRLQIDATVLYCLPEHKEALSESDLKIDDPYNTYDNEGLPPGPICSPGMNSILAAVGPDTTNYYYYVLSGKGTGEHYFARNNNEHQSNIAKAVKERDEAAATGND